MDQPSIVVVKIGGSVLTRMLATGPDLDAESVAALIPDLRATDDRIVLVHGSGSFGKPPAVKYGYLGGKVGPDAAGMVCAISEDLEWLHAALLRKLRRGGMRPATFGASALFTWQRSGVAMLDSRAVRECCLRGLLPVIGSGFVPDLDDGGFAVCSSDAMAAQLAVALGARALVFATDAAGVYSDYPSSRHVYPVLAADDEQELSRIRAPAADVTGGMAEKLRCGFFAASLGIETCVIDGRLGGNLSATLRGQPLSGTRLIAGSRTVTDWPTPAFFHSLSSTLNT
jgi:isopentenyl phosphate kinase